MTVLDLFAGLEGWSAPFRARGHDVISVDVDPRFDVSLCVDVLELQPDDLPWTPDIVLASPPCEGFSVMTLGRSWTVPHPGTRSAHLRAETEPKSETAKLGVRWSSGPSGSSRCSRRPTSLSRILEGSSGSWGSSPASSVGPSPTAPISRPSTAGSRTRNRPISGEASRRAWSFGRYARRSPTVTNARREARGPGSRESRTARGRRTGSSRSLGRPRSARRSRRRSPSRSVSRPSATSPAGIRPVSGSLFGQIAVSATVRRVRGPQMETSESGRFYVWHGERYRSVTSIISGGLPKPALIGWAKKVTAEYAVANLESLKVLVADDPAGAVDWLKGAAYRDRDRKADIGLAIHAAAEAYVLEAPYPAWPEAVAPYMRAFV